MNLISFLLTTAISATFYSDYFEGKVMANGQRFTQQSNTIATNLYPLNTRVKVCYHDRCVVGVVRDKCGRCGVDLSKHLFKQLAPLRRGRLPVRVQKLQ